MWQRNTTTPFSKKELQYHTELRERRGSDNGTEAGRRRQEGGHSNVSAGNRFQGCEQDI